MEKYRVTLTPEERAELEHLVSVGKAAARKLTHARILLLADTAAGEKYSDDEIVAALGVGPCTIGRVRKRLVTEGSALALNPRPQPARRGRIKMRGDVERKLVQLACSDPPQGRCRWTLHLLADELVVLGPVESISAETVRQALKKPHPALDRRDLVRAAQGRRRVRLAHGGRDPDLPVALRPEVAHGLLRMSASSFSARCSQLSRLDRAGPLGWITSTSARASATSC
jgi:hypothetical protein